MRYFAWKLELVSNILWLIVEVQTNHIAAEEPSNSLPSISFPIEYFLSPNKSILFATTPHHLQYLLLLPTPSPALFHSQGYWKILNFFSEPVTLRAEKVKFFTEFLIVFLFHWVIVFNDCFQLTLWIESQ